MTVDDEISSTTRFATPLHTKLAVYTIEKLLVLHLLYLTVSSTPAIECGFD